MGIRNLMTIIKKYCPEEVYNRILDIKDIPKPQGMKINKVGVDTSLLLYKYRHASNKVSQGDGSVKKDIHIVGFINRVAFYLKANTIPIFIFDGKPPAEKDNTLKERREHREKMEEQIVALEDNISTFGEEEVEKVKQARSEIDSIKKNLVYVKKEHFEEIRTLLDLMGIKYFDPAKENLQGEAEHICSTFQKRGLIDHVVTDDTDSFTFGATSVIRSCKKGKVQHIYLNDILKGLELKYDEFVDLCILCGCDYCNTIPKVGPVSSYSAIKKYKSIEKWLESKPTIIKYDSPEFIYFRDNYIKAREIFKKDYEYIPVSIFGDLQGSDILPNYLNEIKEDELREFLKTKGWIDSSISKIINKLKLSRSKIDSLKIKETKVIL